MQNMTKAYAIHSFAIKWLEKFNNDEADFIELVDHWMADDCRELGFVMDCGNSFSQKYGEAFNNSEKLQTILENITDIDLLGSAIYSQWRYYNHWAYTGAEILEPKNRKWFILALRRLAKLSELSEKTIQ